MNNIKEKLSYELGSYLHPWTLLPVLRHITHVIDYVSNYEDKNNNRSDVA